jgi:hypothetical protein
LESAIFLYYHELHTRVESSGVIVESSGVKWSQVESSGVMESAVYPLVKMQWKQETYGKGCYRTTFRRRESISFHSFDGNSK